jgi:hypothetical protein
LGTSILNADINASAGIVTTKLADSTNFVLTTRTNSFGDFNQVFKDNRLLINNPADTFAYTIIGAAIAANRNLTLPLLTGNDTAVAEAFAQTLTNKTIDADSNTITNIENADIKAAAGIVTTKLADSSNFILKTLDNAFGAHYQDFTKMTAPTSPSANDIRFYVDTADTHLKVKNNAGTVTDLMASAAATTLDALTDVTVSSPTNNQVLKYNSGSSQWTNQAEAGGGGSTPFMTKADYTITKESSNYNAYASLGTSAAFTNTALHTLIASVVSALGSTGGVIAFARNTTFSTTASIALANNVTFRGEDRITSIVKSTGAHQIFRWNDGGGAQLLNAGITDLHLVIHDGLTTWESLYIDGSSNFKFNRNWVESKGSSGSGFPSVGTIAAFFDTDGLTHFHDNLEVKDNWWTGYNNGQDAFGNGNIRNGIVTGNFFRDHTDGQAIGAASPAFTVFTNNIFHNVGNAFGFESVTEDCTISGNICYNTTGIKMAGETTTNVSRRNLITDNIIIYGNGGIEAGNCVHDTFVNNKLIRTGTSGIRGSFNGCTIRNNEFIDTNHSNSSTTVNSVSQRRGGIIIFNNTNGSNPIPDMDNNIIQGNRFIDTGATFTDPVSATSKSGNTGGIVLDTNCSSNLLIDNQFVGLPGDPVVDYGIGTFRKDSGERSLIENMKGRYIEGELFMIGGDYGSGPFAATYTTPIGTGNRSHDSTDGLCRYYEAAAGLVGNKSGRATNASSWMRKWLPKIFITFKLFGTTTQHALFLGLASVNDGTSVHATAQLPTMSGIGISVTTDNSNFRIASNSGSASCTYTDTTIAKDTNRHTIEIWTDDTNWYWKLDGGPTGTISSAIPAQTTQMYAVWHNLTNDTSLKDFYLYKYVSRVIIPP